jgi:hypothetical protein
MKAQYGSEKTIGCVGHHICRSGSIARIYKTCDLDHMRQDESTGIFDSLAQQATVLWMPMEKWREI